MNFITPATDTPAEATEGQEPAAAIRDTPETNPAPEAPAKPQQTETPAADQSGAPEMIYTTPTPPPRKPRRDNNLTPAADRAAIAQRNAKYKAAPPTPPEYRAAEDHEEPRSRRVQLLLKPSIFNGIKTVAHWKRQSVNHFLEDILTEYLNTHDYKGRTK